MKKGVVLVVTLAILTVLCPAYGVQTGGMPADALAREILSATAVKGGLVVHLGCGDGKLTAALHANDRYLVHGLDTDAETVETARAYIRSRSLYGPVSVDTTAGVHLPYTDNLVNLVVAENLGDVPTAEVMRVLAPLGVAYLKQDGKWTKTVKPWPPDIDEWPQYLHGADNNAVAHDTVVGPPRHFQWVTEPSWSRSHMTIPTVVSMVSSGGRLFTIEDTASPENPFLPGRFSLVARSAFNGIVLWTRAFPEWEPVTRYVKDITVQLQRRLAAIGDTVYCTPGLSAPVMAFDAATGQLIRSYAGTDRTQEFAYAHGVLYLVIGDRMNAARYNIVKTQAKKGISLGGSDPDAPFDGTGFRGAYAPETPDIPDPVCAIVAIETESGNELWRKDNIHGYTGCSLAIRGRYAVYQTGSGLVCLDRKTGGTIWRVDKQIDSGDGTEPNTLVLSDTAVYAKEGRSLYAYSLEDGSYKWNGPIANCYEKPADLFLAAGAVWTGGSKKPTSRDPDTGQQIRVITQHMTGPMGHDRCYRNFITDRYYINSKTGGADFLTLDGNNEFPNYWLRGTCGMGVLPCNGLLYVPPFSCQCSIGAMINNLNAMYTEKDLRSSDQELRVERRYRLVKGPAFVGAVNNAPSTPSLADCSSEDWPTYRHDAERSGSTTTKVPAELTVHWKAEIEALPSALVVAANKVFVSAVHTHTLYALDCSDGSVVWDYVAGSRIDSPPTYYKGLILFGSRDGWVHCLRASDGVLVWRFKDLPDNMICASGQLESAWPVNGSVLVKDDAVYFAAGRSSFVDGGIFVYSLNPRTGEVNTSRQMYGPFDKTTGFPATGANGFKSDIFVTDGHLLYIRHQPFNPNLTDADSPGAHLISSAGFLDGTPQHRTYWTIGTGYHVSLGNRPSGDILVTDGTSFYEVRGFPVKRHSYFDPRLAGYKLFAGTIEGIGDTGIPGAKKRRTGATSRPAGKWTSDIPLTGKAMVLADDIVFVAGTPVYFPPNHPAAKYEAAYDGNLGGLLWAASAADGSKLAEYKLEAPPCWDGMAAAYGRLYLSMKDGSVMCMGPAG